MLIAPIGPRDRLNLVRKSLRTVQVWTYAAALAALLPAIFADPQHRLIGLAITAFNAIFH